MDLLLSAERDLARSLDLHAAFPCDGQTPLSENR